MLSRAASGDADKYQLAAAVVRARSAQDDCLEMLLGEMSSLSREVETLRAEVEALRLGGSGEPRLPGDSFESNKTKETSDTNDDEADFTLDQVVACSNSGPCTILAVLTTLSTTTSTVTTTSTSTTTLEPVCCGDANRDGRLTSTDALAVLRGAVGLAVNLECSAVCQNPAP